MNVVESWPCPGCAERDALRARLAESDLERERLRSGLREALDIATEVLDEFHDNDPEADLSDDRDQIAELRKMVGRE